MKTINVAAGMGLTCLVFLALFWGTASAGYCISKETGKLVKCTVKQKKNRSKKTVSVQHRGKPANLKFVPWTETSPGK